MARRIKYAPIFWTVLLLNTFHHISQAWVTINGENIGLKLKCERHKINLRCGLGHMGLALFRNPPGCKRFLSITGVTVTSTGFSPHF